MEANARLVAAAPDLLAACKQAVEWIESAARDLGEYPVVPHVLRAAIDAATA